jgi:hypothetical protein
MGAARAGRWIRSSLALPHPDFPRAAPVNPLPLPYRADRARVGAAAPARRADAARGQGARAPDAGGVCGEPGAASSVPPRGRQRQRQPREGRPQRSRTPQLRSRTFRAPSCPPPPAAPAPRPETGRGAGRAPRRGDRAAGGCDPHGPGPGGRGPHGGARRARRRPGRPRRARRPPGRAVTCEHGRRRPQPRAPGGGAVKAGPWPAAAWALDGHRRPRNASPLGSHPGPAGTKHGSPGPS